MRMITVPVEVKIGELTEIGLTLSMEGVTGTSDDKPGRTYSANPAAVGLGLSLSAHQDTKPNEPSRHAYARVSLGDLARTVWAELDKALDSEPSDGPPRGPADA